VRLQRTVVGGTQFAKMGNMAQIKVYTREYCGYCSAAKSLLDGKQLAYEEIDCTGDDKTRAWLRTATGQSTVPQIFIDGKSIGGYTELRALDRSGELAKLLAASVAS
jgi:glutaredoxin 3